MSMSNSESRKRNTPTAPEVGLREAVGALAAEFAARAESRLDGALDRTTWRGAWLAASGDIRDALATHPSPPLPGQPGVAEAVQRVMGEHAEVRRVPLPLNNADLNLGRTRYEMQCACGAEMPWGCTDEQHRAHVAAEVARTLGGAL